MNNCDMPYETWEPTFGAEAGNLRVDQYFAFHKIIGTTVFFQLAFSVDDAAAASGAVTFTLPFPSAHGASFPCLNYNLKKNCNASVFIGSSIVVVHLYDGTFPIKANHQELILNGFYEKL